MTDYNSLISNLCIYQNKLNCNINPNWIAANLSWNRTIIDESGEFFNHLGYKWWKKQVPNIEQAQMELVDILHFILSAYISKNPEIIHNNCTKFNFEEICPVIDPESSMQKVEKIALESLSGNYEEAIKNLVIAFNLLGFGFEELYKQYIYKNVLNIFRQDFGYKQGTYKKVWNGLEDNEVLVSIKKEIEESNKSIPLDQLFDVIYSKLKEKYKEII